MTNMDKDNSAIPYEPYTTPLTKFHLFPHLPQELRLEIWNIILAEPRQIKIDCKKRRILQRRVVDSWTTDTPIPALLHVCSESRYLGLSYYKPYFSTKTCSKAIYLNFERDAIFFQDGILSYLTGEEKRGVQKLVLETKDVAYFGHFNLDFIVQMESLRELEIWGDGANLPSWYDNERYLRNIRGDFEEARNTDPGWECPRVRLMNSKTNREDGIIEGGALIPGWTPADREDGDEIPRRVEIFNW
ncbi:hypothetical protein GLAREA_04765 [Glarea lozoyensis ATCC 20868]|uniref:2EXR domain-containing protein n=1 Tax=Glarea lozoyensis (strain ATCC 20868 / MF5171) TaxID=1116229 RepID=S3CSC6_GLAL2|nr:uncharacterized protein GLAREA_04765 [Glarea lozoyensis ATCC 20868]EPE27974.1 hypothetical protein GLAREA_04765 [Glarea lozoyensis ATCC 20868]